MNPALFRIGTSDRAIWENVNNLNEYRLPEKFSENDVILDIGGNTGAFSHACIQRGAGKVIAFEPDPDNFLIFRKQLKQEIKDGRCEVYPLAVVGGSGFSWRTFSGVVKKDGEINHGGAFLLGPDGNDYGLGEYIVNKPFKVPCIGIEEACDLTGDYQVRLMKLDCEGSEWEILSKAHLSDFEQIVGEYHPVDRFDRSMLEQILSKMETEIVPHPNSELGLFFAHWK